MNILIISGSIRNNSYTKSVCIYVLGVLKANASCKPFVWDLREKELLFFNPDFNISKEKTLNTNTEEFLKKIKDADAIILASPAYHNSVSGVLKNAIDYMSKEIMKNKAIGLISHSTNASTQVVDHLRIIIRSLHAIAIPTQVCSSTNDFKKEDNIISISSTDLKNRINLFSEELISFTKLLNTHRNVI